MAKYRSLILESAMRLFGLMNDNLSNSFLKAVLDAELRSTYSHLIASHIVARMLTGRVRCSANCNQTTSLISLRPSPRLVRVLDQILFE